MEVFQKAIPMSGPSKFLVKIMFRGVIWAKTRSRLHGKFKIPHEAAVREVAEIAELKLRSQVNQN